LTPASAVSWSAIAFLVAGASLAASKQFAR
jgi:hypothetical protein